METANVKTSGPFILVDRFSQVVIDENTSDPVPFTPFIAERIANGDLINLDGDLPEKLASAETAPDEVDQSLSEDPIVDEDAIVPNTDPEPAPVADANNDGHDDKTGEFVEDNKASTGKRGKRGK